VTKEVPQTGISNNEWETAVSESEFTFDAGLQVGASGIEVDLTGGTYVGQYLTAITNSSGQINTDYWTDINSMTADDNASGEFISYALSDDNKQTFYVVRVGQGGRNIVRNNGGAWEYNSASGYDSETWIAASVNSTSDAIKESLSAALIGFDLSNPSYDSVSLSLDPQGTGFYSVFFSPDGLKMFAINISNANVFQYSLTTGFDLTTASYDSVSFSVAGQDSIPYAVYFSPDGLKMFVLGRSNDTVFQYSLTTGFDLTTASYDSVSFSVAGQDGQPESIAFSNDGSKMFVVGNLTNSLHQYTLSTGFDLITASYDSVSFSVAGQDASPTSVAFSNDGSKMFVLGGGAGNVYQYSMSPFDLTTASYDSVSFSVAGQAPNPVGLALSEDGFKMFVVSFNNNSIYQYSMSTTSQNKMDSNQISTAADADFPAVTTTQDLAIVLRTDTSGVTPTSNGVTINYDGNVAHEVARNGTDYIVQKLSDDTLRLKWVASTANTKWRIL
jgi:sugar lactone lactonase YvrE